MSARSNGRIYGLAEAALAATNNDIAAATRLLCEWSGVSFEFAFEAIDDIVTLSEGDQESE